MSEKINDGGMAFPVAARTPPTEKHPHGRVKIIPGMSLRDWFAGQALSGILAGGFADTIPHDDVNGGRDVAFFAYQYADAMLKVREASNG